MRITSPRAALVVAVLLSLLTGCHRGPTGPAPAPSSSVDAPQKFGAFSGTTARFTINGTAASPPGYDGTNSQTITLQLATNPAPDVYQTRFSIYNPSDPGSPLASASAPVLTLSPSTGIAATPTSAVTFVLPASGSHTYKVRCVINGGVQAATGAVVPQWTFERIVAIRNASSLVRKLLPGETTEYSPRGWADEQNTMVDNFASGGPPSGAAGGDWSGSFPTGTNVKVNGQRVPWKSTVRVAATSNITLSGTQTVDGVALSVGDVVLATAQTAASQNGPYVVASGAWSRRSDFAASADALAASRFTVSEGTLWSNTDWTLGTQGAVTLGTTALTFTPDRAATVAALRTVSGKTDGQKARLLSYQAPGDRGDSDVYWDATSTATDDGCLVFAPTGVSTGRWKRLFTQSLPVTWCGAGHNSASQDTAAIQAVFDLLSHSGVALNSTRVVFASVNAANGGYLINATLTLQGVLQSSILLEGEAQPGIGTAEGVKLTWVGSSNYSGALLEAIGTTGLTLRNIVIDGVSKPKYLVWLHPDHTHSLGSTHTTLDNCVLRNPANMSGAAALALGDTGGEPSQTDTIRLWSTDIEGNAINGAPLDGGLPDYSAYVADGILNLHGGNTKNVWLYGSNINYFRYAFNLEHSSGPVVMYGGSASAETGAVVYGSDVNFTAHEIDCEQVAAFIRTPGAGSAFGNVALYRSEVFLFPYTLNNQSAADGYDYGIDWWNGRLTIDGGTYANYRIPSLTGATNATPIVIAAAAHALKTGDKVTIYNVGGNTAANGWRRVTKIDADHFSLQDPDTGANIAGSGAYTSGGSFEPEFKIRIANQDPAAWGGIAQSSSASIRNAYFQGSHGHSHVEDTSGNDLLSRAFVSSVSYPVMVESLRNSEVQAGTGAGIPMRDAESATPFLLDAHAGVLAVDSTTGAVTGSTDIGITSATIPGQGAYNLTAVSKEASQDYLDFGDATHAARSYVRAATGGLASLSVGTTDIVKAQEAQVSIGVSPLAFVDGFDPVLTQNAISGNSISGHTFIVRGQSMFGNNDIGSNLSLRPGPITGTSPTLGYVQITDGSNAEKFRVGGAGLGFYGTMPVAQPSRVGQLTDGTTGTPSATIGDVGGAFSQTVLNNINASLLAKINALELVIHNNGLCQ